MEDEGGGFKLSKKSSIAKEGEVDYRTKAGTAWSHNFLNQKPWHPLSYPNQRRKWIAEQSHAQKERRAEEIAREYAQEQDFLRQTALLAKKEKEKLEMMKGVSFMYVKPPGFNPESAKAAEATDEKKKQEDEKNSNVHEPSREEASSSMKPESAAEKKKQRPKDVFGRALPTEEQFEVLKNAPKLDTGVAGRAKPFGVEIRNVKCLRCGNYGHQSGDRECPLKDVIMPNEESRLKRDDPLTAILAQTDPTEPLKWELKQKPGLSPPRGGFDPEDPNQQIVAEDIFDEYGGFLGESVIPELLNNFNASKTKKKSSKSKHKRKSSPVDDETRHDRISDPSSGDDKRKKSKKRNKKKAKAKHSESCSSEGSEGNKHKEKRHRHKHTRSSSSEPSDFDDIRKSRHRNQALDMNRHRDADLSSDRYQHGDREHQLREQDMDKDLYRDRDRDQNLDRRRRQDQGRDQDREQYQDSNRRGDWDSNYHQHWDQDRDLERHQRRHRDPDLEQYQHGGRDRDWEQYQHRGRDRDRDLTRHQERDRDPERHQHRDRDQHRHRHRHRHHRHRSASSSD